MTELVSYAHWAESWFRYMAAAALLKPDMLPNLAAHAAFIGVAAARFPDRLIQYDRAYRLNRNALREDWKRAEALDPEFSIYSLPRLNASTNFDSRKHEASSAPSKPKDDPPPKPLDEQYC